MTRVKTALTATVLALAATTVVAAGAGGAERPGTFQSTIIGRPVGAAVAIRGVSAGGAPWVVSQGHTHVNAAGQVGVEVKGLLITGTGTANDGTTGPVHSIAASVTCEGTVPVIVSTDAVPLSADGDAHLEQRVDLPSTCLAPIVLVRANSATGPWIAASGL
jgi:hypothetical protein